jgi:hypothetical protein
MSEELSWRAVCVGWGLIGAVYAAACVWLGVRIFNRRERWAKWSAALLAVTPALYVLSSGPLTMVAFSNRLGEESTVLPDGTMRLGVTQETSLGTWFPIAYAPLLWASEQEWGDPIFWYWDVFPNRQVVEGP